MNTITIPKKMSRKGDLVVVPRIDYEHMLKISQRLLREEKDTDEAIRVFERERKIGKLKRSSSFYDILVGRDKSLPYLR
ncbi:MAG: hypothetical protein G01um101430_617 [Parcubacteria group bacterium Gr01-1014_30]|nr:MAG: hypothetical protein G01um101430_617 [Parcubacteria group bacterium Gr01-1014_30]